MMNEYGSPYGPVVPRLLPSEYSAKKIPMVDDRHQYIDNRSTSSYRNASKGGYPSPNSHPLSIQNQFHEEENMPVNSFNGQPNNRFHHETLKDNSGDYFSRNSPFDYSYPVNSNSNVNGNSSKDSCTKSTKTLIVIFGILIALFSLTALGISIYLLIRMTTTSSSSLG